MISRISLFPTDIYVKECDLDIAEIEKSCYDHQKKESRKYRSGTGYQGYEYHNQLLEKLIIDNIPMSKNKSLENIEVRMWLNINKFQEYNELHDHDPYSGTFLSGVYYVKVPENGGNLRLYDPRFFVTNAPDMKYYYDGHKYESILARENLLVYFPSWILHNVEPNLSNQDRISIAFNIKADFDY